MYYDISFNANKANFFFSHFKSEGTLSCHSNEFKWSTVIQSIILEDANATHRCAKIKPNPLMTFDRKKD